MWNKTFFSLYSRFSCFVMQIWVVRLEWLIGNCVGFSVIIAGFSKNILDWNPVFNFSWKVSEGFVFQSKSTLKFCVIQIFYKSNCCLDRWLNCNQDFHCTAFSILLIFNSKLVNCLLLDYFHNSLKIYSMIDENIIYHGDAWSKST